MMDVINTLVSRDSVDILTFICEITSATFRSKHEIHFIFKKLTGFTHK